jgi:hypothetical protein
LSARLVGDDKLIAGLPVSLIAQAPKASCKVRIEDWIHDAQRNPQHFTFEEISTPPVVQRVVALSEASLAAISANDKIPAGLQKPPVVSLPPMAPSTSPVDLGPAGRNLTQAEGLCNQIQKKAADAPANAPIKRFSDSCGPSLKRIRATMEQAARTNPSQERLQAIADDAANFTAIAQQFLSSAN